MTDLAETPGSTPPPRGGVADVRPAVWDRLLVHCPPFVPDGLWDRFRDAGAHHTPADPGAAFAALREEFPDEALVAAGVLTAGRDGTPEPDPRLADPGGVVIALRSARGRPPYDLLVGDGCLSGAPLPALAVLGDVVAGRGEAPAGGPVNLAAATDDHAEISDDDPEDRHADVVFVTSSLRDAAALRSLGFTAAPAAGLADLGRERLVAFKERFVTYAGTTGYPERRLVIADWSPATLGPHDPSGTAAICEHFAALHAHLGLDTYESWVWLPTDGDVAALECALRFGLGGDVRKAVSRSVSESGRPLVREEPSPRQRLGAPADYAEAASQVGEARRVGADRFVRKKVWQACESRIEETLIRPLMDLAQHAADPVFANLLATFANASRVFQLTAMDTAERLQRSIASGFDGRPETQDQAPRGDVADLERQAAVLINLTRELHRCRERNGRTIVTTAVGGVGGGRSLTSAATAIPATYSHASD